MGEQLTANPACDKWDRWLPRLITSLAVAMILARLSLVFRRLYDPDELQHLHAGYSVWRGQIPYLDFFEQHQPVLWYLSLPLFAVCGASLRVLFAGRILIWIGGGLTFWLTWVAGNRYFGRFAAAVGVLLLAIHPPYQEKNVEWRPDNLAVPAFLAAILALERMISSNQFRWGIVSGIAFAASFFCTQKVAYAGVGVGAAYLLVLPRSVAGTGATTFARAARLTIALAVGAACVTALVIGFFRSHEALDRYVELTLKAPLAWQTREPIGLYVVNQLASGVVFWGAGVAGFVLVLAESMKRQSNSVGATLIAGGAFTHVAGLLHVPAAFHQYYLPISPLVAVLAGNALAALTNRRVSTLASFARWLALAAGVAVATEALNLRRLVTLLSPVWVPVIAATLTAAGVVCVFKYRRIGACLILSAAGMGAFSYHLIQFQWTHADQTQRIEQLMHATSERDAFFDGFTGFGALRPHAFYVFWINHHSWPMIPMADRIGGVTRALAEPHTRVVLFDQNLSRFLPGDVLQQIDRDFAPDARYSEYPSLIVYVRRDHPLPADGPDNR